MLPLDLFVERTPTVVQAWAIIEAMFVNASYEGRLCVSLMAAEGRHVRNPENCGDPSLDVVGYSRLAGADEDRTLARLRGLRGDLIDPAIAAHRGRVVKRTGDGSIIEFRSVVDAVRCAIEVQNGLIERNAGVTPERRIEFRIGIHLGDVVEEGDGDLMGDGVNIAARLEGVAKPGGICLSEDAYRHVKGRLDLQVSDLGPIQLKNIAEPVRVYALDIGKRAEAQSVTPASPAPAKKKVLVGSACRSRRFPLRDRGDIRLACFKTSIDPRLPTRGISRWWCCPSPISRATRTKTTSPTGSRKTSPPTCRGSARAS